MRRILASTSTALALILAVPAAILAQGQQQQDQNREWVDITTWDQSDLYTGWRAEHLLDSEVQDTQGEEIGEVEDLIIGPDGQIQKVVIEAGGFLDIGDTHFAMPWDEVVRMGTAVIQVPFDSDNIEDYSVFGDIDDQPAEGRNWRISELMGDYLGLAGGVRYGFVEDVIFSQDGEIQAVIAEPSVGYGYRGPYAFPYYGYGYGFDPGLDVYETPYSVVELEQIAPFDYGRVDSGVASTE